MPLTSTAKCMPGHSDFQFMHITSAQAGMRIRSSSCAGNLRTDTHKHKQTNEQTYTHTQHTTHNTQHTTHNTQHTTHNTQHTTHNTQHTTQHTTHNPPTHSPTNPRIHARAHLRLPHRALRATHRTSRIMHHASHADVPHQARTHRRAQEDGKVTSWRPRKPTYVLCLLGRSLIALYCLNGKIACIPCYLAMLPRIDAAG